MSPDKIIFQEPLKDLKAPELNTREGLQWMLEAGHPKESVYGFLTTTI